MQAPPEVLELAQLMSQGKPLPEWAECSPDVYKPRQRWYVRLWQWMKPKSNCGCNRRERWMNSKIPYSGTVLRWFTTITGLKWLVDRWYQRT